MSAAAGDLERTVLNEPGSTPLDGPGMTGIFDCAPLGAAFRRALVCAGIACSLLGLAGCHRGLLKEHTCNKPQPYASSQSIPPLRVPLGVDAPDTRAALQIPPLNEPTPPPRSLRDPCLDEPPSYATPGSSSRGRVPGL